jgi:hypothetical protein
MTNILVLALYRIATVRCSWRNRSLLHVGSKVYIAAIESPPKPEAAGKTGEHDVVHFAQGIAWGFWQFSRWIQEGCTHIVVMMFLLMRICSISIAFATVMAVPQPGEGAGRRFLVSNHHLQITKIL